ncbi:DMT family transporter [Herbiconiux daphne]|uniref:DMT family transporter n=1 Tax=Herbiconiux daphne TaxID=2970914 RepID=A0ABT2H2B2_9MICO|nr:DMT family transporter [Herbiconiux daphne]MCS5734086.1 DMT family transporter [Herbiconiux daphne]
MNAPAGPRRRTVVAVVSLVAATLFWAGNYVVGAAAVASIDPLSLVFLRWLIAVGPLLVIAQPVERPRWRDALRAWPRLVLLAAFGLFAYTFLLYSALQFTDAFNASLINAFNPALITIAAVVFLREKLSPAAIAGILLALVGVLIVLSGGDPLALVRTGFGVGDLLMIAAIVAWTAYTIVGRRVTGIPPITSTALQAAITVVALAPVVLITGGPTLPQTPDAWGALAFIGIFPSVLSYLLWNRALGEIPPARAGVFLNLITVFTAAFTIIAGHPFTAAQIIGGVVVIAGVAVANERAFSRRA